MTSERAQSYGKVLAALESLGSGKLHAEEQQVVRGAADAMLFCDDLPGDDSASLALGEFYELIDRLLESERVSPDTARALTDAVDGCGPALSRR